MQANQVLVEARHCNPLLQFHAQKGEAIAAKSALQKMKSLGATANVASFEILAEVSTCSVKLCSLNLA